jgi:hypothetical protein
MKTILWAALTANGNYAQSSPEHPPKKEALDDFVLRGNEKKPIPGLTSRLKQ